MYGEDEHDKNIALNPFCESLFAVLAGYHTVAQVKTFYDMTTAEGDELDTLVSRVTAHAAGIERHEAVHRIRCILTFWEHGGIPGYQTTAEIQARLNEV